MAGTGESIMGFDFLVLLFAPAQARGLDEHGTCQMRNDQRISVDGWGDLSINQ